MDAKKKKSNRNLAVSQDAELILKKHVGLIHCENKLTLIQRKICNILLFNALDKINEQENHEISLRQLCSLVGYNSNDSKLIKDSIKTLISVVMEWNLLEDSKFLHEDEYPEDAISWNASALLAGASIKNGIIRYSYSPQIKSVLSSLEIYGRINLFVQAKFNSTYSLVLYENCVRFKNIKQTSWFTIELFRSLMGVSDDKYPSFKEFKRNVINVAVKEINQKSDIFIEPRFKKSGRAIVGVQFAISDNEGYKPTFRKANRLQPALPAQQQQSTLLETLMSDWQLSEKQAMQIMTDYQQDYILQKMQLVKAKKNIQHPGAYLMAALKNDFTGAEKQQSTSGRVENTYLRETRQASEMVSLKNKYTAYKLKTYMDYVQQQVGAIQQAIKETFEQYLKPKVEVFRLYKKSGLASPFVMSDYISFIDKHYPDVVGDYLSFDDYISSEV